MRSLGSTSIRWDNLIHAWKFGQNKILAANTRIFHSGAEWAQLRIPWQQAWFACTPLWYGHWATAPARPVQAPWRRPNGCSVLKMPNLVPHVLHELNCLNPFLRLNATIEAQV
jgi:hypothetical protein